MAKHRDGILVIIIVVGRRGGGLVVKLVPMHSVDCVGGFLGVVIQDGILIASTWRDSEMIPMMTGVGVLEWHFCERFSGVREVEKARRRTVS